MNRKIISIVITAAIIVIAVSCNNKKTSGRANTKNKDTQPTFVIDTLHVGDSAVGLCPQILTSIGALETITDTTSHSYDRETTPVEQAFFYLPEDLAGSKTAKLLMRRYNLCAVINHVVHSYELFQRKSSDLGFNPDDDSTSVITKADTLALIAEDIIPVTSSLLAKAFPDMRDRKAAHSILAAYDQFDGDDSEGSPFSNAFAIYREYFETVPELVSEETLDEFSEKFWDWYDKKTYFPEIDAIQILRMKDKANLSEEQMEHFRRAVESETDIDRRTILALEYAKWHEWYGALLLGEILESGQYTRYLLEAWITWRALVQMTRIGPSSFCVIPNNYYDQVRVKCMETMLRHYESSKNPYELCMLENLLMIQILHRQGSIAGNESMATLANLQYGMFVHPRVTESEE